MKITSKNAGIMGLYAYLDKFYQVSSATAKKAIAKGELSLQGKDITHENYLVVVDGDSHVLMEKEIILRLGKRKWLRLLAKGV